MNKLEPSTKPLANGTQHSPQDTFIIVYDDGQALTVLSLYIREQIAIKKHVCAHCSGESFCASICAHVISKIVVHRKPYPTSHNTDHRGPPDESLDYIFCVLSVLECNAFPCNPLRRENMLAHCCHLSESTGTV